MIEKLYQVLQKNPFHKLGLKKTLEVYKLLGSPADTYPTIHVGGTNGKGSVCHKIASVLSHEGYKVGLFTSPHISSIRERIRLNMTIISLQDFEEALKPIFFLLEKMQLEINFFEILTLAALQFFAGQKVDVAVIEVGLGGRLDATNIIHPILSVITSIGMDHMHILGKTLEEIAKEKAGIIKSKTPLIIGQSAALSPVLDRAKELLCPLEIVQGNFSSFNEENTFIAKACLDCLSSHFPLSQESIYVKIEDKPVCRMEIFSSSTIHRVFPKAVILDVAHNLDGLIHLKKSLDYNFSSQNYICILALSKNKDIESFCKYLSGFVQEVHLAMSPHQRLEEPKKIAKHFSSKIKIFIHDSYQKALESILLKENDYILVCGSFFMMQQIRSALGIEEECDEKHLIENI